MTMIVLKLKLVGSSRYALFGPKDNQISGVFQGPKDKAIEWAKAFCSSQYNWGVDFKEIIDEEASGVLE